MEPATAWSQDPRFETSPPAQYTANGRWADLQPWVGPGTDVIDVAGRTVTAALIDSHTHFHRGAIARRCFIDFEAHAPAGIDDVVELVRGAAAAAPPGTWIQGDSLSPSRLREGR